MKRARIAFLLVALMAKTLSAAEFDVNRAIEFVRLCQNTADRQPNLRCIYWKLKTFEAAGKDFDVAPYAAYERTLQNADGGCGFWPKDASTPEGTLDALTVLQAAKAAPPDAPACVRWLNARLAEEAESANLYSDLLIQRNIHSCLISLALLGAEPPELDRYLKILEQDGRPWGMYYRLSAAKAFNRPVDKERWIRQLDDLASLEYLNWTWRRSDRYYALEAMDLLGGRFTYAHWIREGTDEPRYGPNDNSRRPSLHTFMNAYRSVRMGKLTGIETPWLEAWLKESTVIEPGPVGGYAAMPGMESEAQASLAAAAILKQRVPVEGASAMAEPWSGKEQKAGYFESSPPDRRWLSESDVFDRRVDETWQACACFKLAGAAPPDKAAVVNWLNEVLQQHRADLGSGPFLRALECFTLLDERLENTDAIAAYCRERFASDPVVAVRALEILGVQPRMAGAGDEIRSFLDRIRTRATPMEISLLAERFEALEALGEGCEGTTYFIGLLG